MKHKYLTGNNKNGSAFSVGHLSAATACNGSPAPDTFSSWMYNYIVGDLNHLEEEVSQELSGSIFEDLYKQVGGKQL